MGYNLIRYEERRDDESHEDLGKPFRIEARIKNNRLIRAREELGLTQKKASVMMGDKHQSMLMNYENFKLNPWCDSQNKWKDSAVKIAKFYGYSPEELWPEAIQAIKKNFLVLEASTRQIEKTYLQKHEIEDKKLKQGINVAIESLPNREQEIIKKSFGLNKNTEQTLKEIGKNISRIETIFKKGKYQTKETGEIGISPENVRIIKEKALSKIRKQLNSKNLLVDPED